MKIVVALTAASLAAASFLVFGAPSGPHEGHFAERLRTADTNGDGMISRAEAQAGLPMIARHFDQIDANRDGQITQDELRAFHEQRRAAMEQKRAEHWKKIDTDGDGRISRAEAQANAPRLAEHFDAIDANRDGFITPDELRAAHRHHHQAAK
jgi:Ca2+-binding EF-hand superfamily protein